jgi:hypothetical protein
MKDLGSVREYIAKKYDKELFNQELQTRYYESENYEKFCSELNTDFIESIISNKQIETELTLEELFISLQEERENEYIDIYSDPNICVGFILLHILIESYYIPSISINYFKSNNNQISKEIVEVVNTLLGRTIEEGVIHIVQYVYMLVHLLSYIDVGFDKFDNMMSTIIVSDESELSNIFKKMQTKGDNAYTISFRSSSNI